MFSELNGDEQFSAPPLKRNQMPKCSFDVVSCTFNSRRETITVMLQSRFKGKSIDGGGISCAAPSVITVIRKFVVDSGDDFIPDIHQQPCLIGAKKPQEVIMALCASRFFFFNVLCVCISFSV